MFECQSVMESGEHAWLYFVAANVTTWLRNARHYKLYAHPKILRFGSVTLITSHGSPYSYLRRLLQNQLSPTSTVKGLCWCYFYELNIYADPVASALSSNYSHLLNKVEIKVLISKEKATPSKT